MQSSTFTAFLFSLPALYIALTFHEFLHAWTADYLGDPTPRAAGRVSLNPLAHIDLYGTFLVPVLLVLLGIPAFGWAKPVPINPNNFKNYRLGELLTAIAGPLANLIQILVFATIYKLIPYKESIFGLFVLRLVLINGVLMIFNLIPIPPLDGSKVIYSFLPFEWVRRLEVYGPFLLIPLLFLAGPLIIWPALNFILGLLGIPLNLF